MSTNYYFPLPGISSIRLHEGEAHDQVTVFQEGKNAGTLTLSKGTGRTIVSALSVDDDIPPVRTYGSKSGIILEEHYQHLDELTCLISEYGEPITLRELRRKTS